MPRSFVTAVGVPIAARPESVTVTPGRTPPWSSVTLPTTSPNVWPVCAAAGARPNANTIARAANARMNVRVKLTSSRNAGMNLCESGYRVRRAFEHKCWAIFATYNFRYGYLDCRGSTQPELPFLLPDFVY